MSNRSRSSRLILWWLALITAILLGLTAVQGYLAFRQYDRAKTERADYSKEPLDRASDLEWAKKIQDGGYILHFRHAEREKWNDVTAFDQMELTDKLDASKESFSRATCLTERGIEEAKLVGWSFQHTGVEISEVLTSPSCRSRQTSLYAFGGEGRIVNALLHRTAVPLAQHEEFARALRAELDKVEIVPGKNVILSGHGGTLSVDGSIVIDDSTAVPGIDSRNESGFVVLEKVDGKIIARHMFKNFWQYDQVAVSLELN